ncbi:MAG: TetR/AcrR family transcriptional regulator C-terminal domain-containing protein [Acidimicrobiia bacterium]|nr:TetR/AcrR family transcriptional regulator C-terminal domain-containing protein [Acidimicrobiia bacterium]
MEAVLSEAVTLLDEAGEQALTFRALAARLGGGVGSIYWYVTSKEDLLDRAADHVVGDVLRATDDVDDPDDPIAEIRAIAVTMFDAVERRPWLAAYFMTNTEVQPNTMRLYERLGRPLLRLDLTTRQRFHAVSAVTGFVVGTAADLGQQRPPEVLDGTVGRDEYIERFAEDWRRLDPAEFPFVHEIVDEFAGHDDTDQFRAGLDLILDGLRLQAGTARRARQR